MKDNKSLKDMIIEKVFIYETKQLTYEAIIKSILLFLSVVVIIVFGGVIGDIFTENELGGLMLGEMGSVIFDEIPGWVFIAYLSGLTLGCILIGVVIKNRKLLHHKIKSIIQYWFHI